MQGRETDVVHVAEARQGLDVALVRVGGQRVPEEEHAPDLAFGNQRADFLCDVTVWHMASSVSAIHNFTIFEYCTICVSCRLIEPLICFFYVYGKHAAERLGVNNKASPPGRHQEQAPKQRCTFSPTTFSSVQF